VGAGKSRFLPFASLRVGMTTLKRVGMTTNPKRVGITPLNRVGMTNLAESG